MDWLETIRAVLTHIGYPAELLVRMATGAMQQEGRAWWDSIHFRHFENRMLDQLSWAEFRVVFYDQYFSHTIRSLKKQEFLSLRQEESTTVAEYQVTFLRLERFASSSFTSERERAAQFVAGLRISLRSVVAPFTCATLTEAVRKALECEHAHVSVKS